MKCKWCSSSATIKQGRIWLCDKHYRFQQMRVLAARKTKLVPEYSHLESMFATLHEMQCPCCKEKMHLRGKHGMSKVMTLQHDRSGNIRFMCLSCNTRHQHFDGDTFYTHDPSTHPCRDCGKVLPKDAFWKDRSRPLGIKSYCKECNNKRIKKWASNNRTKLRRKSREYRKSKREE